MPSITNSAGVLQFLGSPLKEFGVNSYQLFYQGASSGSFTVANTRLAAIASYGVRIVRTLLCPFFPNDLDLYRNTPTTFFSRMTAFLDLCSANNISIIANIAWRHATWTDIADVNTLDSSVSTARALLRNYTTDVVSRYFTHPAIAAWEIGNEYDLYKDSASYLPSVSIGNGTKASYSAPNDVLSSAAITGIYGDFVTAIRAYDADRLIIAGTACAYGTATLSAWQSSMMTDSPGMGAISRHMYPGVSGVSNTANTGPFGNNCTTAFYGLRHMAKTAEVAGTPLIVGEFGCATDYAYATRMDVINHQVDAIIAAEIPLAMLWNYPDGPSVVNDITDLMPNIAGWTASMADATSTLKPVGRIYSSDAGYFVRTG